MQPDAIEHEERSVREPPEVRLDIHVIPGDVEQLPWRSAVHRHEVHRSVSQEAIRRRNADAGDDVARRSRRHEVGDLDQVAADRAQARASAPCSKASGRGTLHAGEWTGRLRDEAARPGPADRSDIRQVRHDPACQRVDDARPDRADAGGRRDLERPLPDELGGLEDRRQGPARDLAGQAHLQDPRSAEPDVLEPIDRVVVDPDRPGAVAGEDSGAVRDPDDDELIEAREEEQPAVRTPASRLEALPGAREREGPKGPARAVGDDGDRHAHDDGDRCQHGDERMSPAAARRRRPSCRRGLTDGLVRHVAIMTACAARPASGNLGRGLRRSGIRCIHARLEDHQRGVA